MTLKNALRGHLSAAWGKAKATLLFHYRLALAGLLVSLEATLSRVRKAAFSCYPAWLLVYALDVIVSASVAAAVAVRDARGAFLTPSAWRATKARLSRR